MYTCGHLRPNSKEFCEVQISITSGWKVKLQTHTQ